MRCLCCNRNLSDYESTLRHPETLAFLDICKVCLKEIPITPVESGRYEQDVGYEEVILDDDGPYIEDEDE
jgi:hypothetical protein